MFRPDGDTGVNLRPTAVTLDANECTQVPSSNLVTLTPMNIVSCTAIEMLQWGTGSTGWSSSFACIGN